MAHQTLEQGELALRQVDGLIGDADLAGDLVEHDSAEPKYRLVTGAVDVTAAAEGAKAGTELRVGEGLDEVVVGTGVETGHPVPHGIASCEHQDRQGQTVGTEGAADLQAIDVGQADVEDDQVQPVGCDGEFEALMAGRSVFHDVVVLGEEPGE